MEEISRFCQTLREGILDYYDRTHTYIKDLFSYKNVNLKFDTVNESEENIKNVVEMMIKIIQVALTTIGVKKEKISIKESEFEAILNKRGKKYHNYNTYYNELKNVVDKFLLQILIEYLIDIDVHKIENLQLFDLLPKDFKNQIDRYKSANITSNEMKSQIQQNISEIENHIDFSDLTIKQSEEKDILKKLGDAKRANLEVLQSSELLSDEIINGLDLLEPMIPATHSHSEGRPIIRPLPGSEINIFFDFFGNFSSFDSSIVKKFRINYDNLLHSFGSNLKEYFYLETLFYFINILKMINLPLPFSSTEIIEIVKNQINEKVFSSSKSD